MNNPITLQQFVDTKNIENLFPTTQDITSESFKQMKQDLIQALVFLGHKMQICRKDFMDSNIEIGVKIDEETSYKARAILGRLIQNSSWDDTLLFLKSAIKLSCFLTVEETAELNALLYKTDVKTVNALNLALPCSILFTWILIIETGICAQTEVKEKRQCMPPTLNQLIFLENLSRVQIAIYNQEVTLAFSLETLSLSLKTVFNILINNAVRYRDKQPHNSDVIYLTVAKNAYERSGGDSSDFLSLCIDDEYQNWSLFQFLSINTQ